MTDDAKTEAARLFAKHKRQRCVHRGQARPRSGRSERPRELSILGCRSLTSQGNDRSPLIASCFGVLPQYYLELCTATRGFVPNEPYDSDPKLISQGEIASYIADMCRAMSAQANRHGLLVLSEALRVTATLAEEEADESDAPVH